MDKAGVDRDVKLKDWTDDQAAKIREIIGAEYKVEGDLYKQAFRGRSRTSAGKRRMLEKMCIRDRP